MSGVFKANVRRVGTSLGVLIPKEVLREEKIREGDQIELGVVKRKKVEEVVKLFGTAKGTKPFERERRERGDRW